MNQKKSARESVAFTAINIHRAIIVLDTFKEALNNNYFLFMLLLSVPSFGQSTKPLFDIEKVSERVYVAKQKKSMRVDATSTIIVGATFITVVDATSNETSGKVLIEQIKSVISHKPIKYLIITHPHVDNAAGAFAFKSGDTRATIIAHSATRKKIKDALPKKLSGHINHINRLLTSNDFKSDNGKERYLDLQQFRDDLTSSRIIAPDIAVTDSLTLFDEDLEINVWHPGHGHSPGDLLIYVPGEHIIITGDLVHDFDPLFFGDADPDQWILILNRIETLPFRYLIGARGTVQEGKEILISYRSYLTDLTTIVKSGITKGISKETFLETLAIDSIPSLQQNNYGLRMERMRGEFQDEIWNLPLVELARSNVSQVWDYYFQKIGSKQ